MRCFSFWGFVGDDFHAFEFVVLLCIGDDFCHGGVVLDLFEYMFSLG